MSRLPERDTRAGAQRERPLQVAAEQRRRSRSIFLLIFTIGPYLAFTKHVPFTSYGYELNATFANARQHLEKLAGADRRRRSRQSDRDRARRRRHQGHLHRRRRRPADPRRRLRPDPPADLPRGQLLHRTRPRQPQRAGDGQRRHDPGQPHLDRGPARRDPHRAAVAGAGRPRPPAARASARRSTHEPTAAEDATQLPEVQGKTGAEALNGALKYGGDAGRYSAQVTNAFLGTEPHDLSRLVAGTGRTFGAFASREGDLQGLIVNFDVFTGALADQSANLATHDPAASRRP